MAPIVSHLELEKSDFLAMWDAVPEARSLRWMVFAMVAVMVVTLSFVAPDLWASAANAALLLLCSAAAVGAMLIGIMRGKRKMAERALEDLGGAIELEFSDGGMCFRTKLRQGEIAWGAMKRSLETASHFFVYTGTQMLMPVPKRGFSDADVAVLRRMLVERANLNAKAKRLPPGLARLLLSVIVLVVFLSLWNHLSHPEQPGQPATDSPAEPVSE